jgi:eukaryotic-like serine/threonine-protein kinase
MGRVYRARHARMSRRFAVKVLFGDLSVDSKAQSRFALEAEAASRLDHANLVSVVDFGETDAGLLYLAMDLAEGETLAELVDREGPLPRERVARLVRQLCAGLAHAHDKGLVHRDFKTENVLVSSDADGDVARIVDFGIAVLLEAAGSGRLTTQGMVLGTPAYMSPEQATAGALDGRTDLFSLGVMLYEMLSGVLPFEGTAVEVARANVTTDPPPIAERVPGLAVDAGLEEMASKLMAKLPAERYQSATEVITALDELEAAWLRGPTSPAAAPDPAPDPAPRRRAWWALAVAAAAAVIVAAFAIPALLRDGRGAAPEHDAAVALGAPAPEVPVATGIDEALADAGDVRPPDDGPDQDEARTAAANEAAAEKAAADRAAAEKAAADRAAADRAAADRAAADRAAAEKAAAEKAAAEKAAAEKAAAEKAAAEKAAAEKAAAEKAAAEAAPIAIETLSARYRTVGAALDELARTRGEAAAAPLRQRYFAIPYADALRTPSLRRDVDRELRRLRADIDLAHEQ